MKNNKTRLYIISIFLITYILLKRSIYSEYSKYVLLFSIPFVIYFTYKNFNTFSKSNVVNSKTTTLFKDENLQIISGLFLIIGLILRYFDFDFWKYICCVGFFFFLLLLLRRAVLHFNK